MPVAVVLGGPPALLFAADLPAPADLDSLTLASLLAGEPLEVVKCRTHALEVPATAELILEGFISSNAIEHRSGASLVTVPAVAGGYLSGHYLSAQAGPVMQVAAMTQRASPLLPYVSVDLPGDAPQLQKARERILCRLLRSQLPELVDLALPAAAGRHGLAILAIHKTEPRQALRVAHSFWGHAATARTKLVIVVDADGVDIHDAAAVFGIAAVLANPVGDLHTWQGMADRLDLAATAAAGGGKLLIDATAKLPGEREGSAAPQGLTPQGETVRLVAERWRDYGLGGLAAPGGNAP